MSISITKSLYEISALQVLLRLPDTLTTHWGSQHARAPRKSLVFRYLSQGFEIPSPRLLPLYSTPTVTNPPIRKGRDSLGSTTLWRSEARRVGKECVSPCRSRRSPYNKKKKKKK